MRRVKTAVIGAGFMGKVHSEAIRRVGNVDLVAVAAVSAEEAAGFGESIGVERTTGDYRTLLAIRRFRRFTYVRRMRFIIRWRKKRSKPAKQCSAKSLSRCL